MNSEGVLFLAGPPCCPQSLAHSLGLTPSILSPSISWLLIAVFVASWSEDGCHGSRNPDCFPYWIPYFSCFSQGDQTYFSPTPMLTKTWSHSPPAFKKGQQPEEDLTNGINPPVSGLEPTNHNSSLKAGHITVFLHTLFFSKIQSLRQEMTGTRSPKLIRAMPSLSETDVTL